MEKYPGNSNEHVKEHRGSTSRGRPQQGIQGVTVQKRKAKVERQVQSAQGGPWMPHNPMQIIHKGIRISTGLSPEKASNEICIIRKSTTWSMSCSPTAVHSKDVF